MFHGSTDDVIDRVCAETTLSTFCRTLCAILFGTKEHVGTMSKGAAGGSFVERMSLEHTDFICVSWVDAPFLPVKYERSVLLVVAAGCVHVQHETSSFSEAAGLLSLFRYTFFIFVTLVTSSTLCRTFSNTAVVNCVPSEFPVTTFRGQQKCKFVRITFVVGSIRTTSRVVWARILQIG